MQEFVNPRNDVYDENFNGRIPRTRPKRRPRKFPPENRRTSRMKRSRAEARYRQSCRKYGNEYARAEQRLRQTARRCPKGKAFSPFPIPQTLRVRGKPSPD